MIAICFMSYSALQLHCHACSTAGWVLILCIAGLYFAFKFLLILCMCLSSYSLVMLLFVPLYLLLMPLCLAQSPSFVVERCNTNTFSWPCLALFVAYFLREERCNSNATSWLSSHRFGFCLQTESARTCNSHLLQETTQCSTHSC